MWSQFDLLPHGRLLIPTKFVLLLRLLIHVVNGSSRDPCGDFAAIQQELALFSPGLAEKRQLVVFNKMDLPDSADYEDIVREFLVSKVMPACFYISICRSTARCVQQNKT